MFEAAMKRIISYNVNGIRSALNKGLGEWIQSVQPDIICVQELKAMQDQVDVSFFDSEGYYHYWFPAAKKGYSGVAIYSRVKPSDCFIENAQTISRAPAIARYIQAMTASFASGRRAIPDLQSRA